MRHGSHEREGRKGTHRIVRGPVVDALKLDAGSATTSGEGLDVAVGGDADSAEEGVLGSRQVSIATSALQKSN